MTTKTQAAVQAGISSGIEALLKDTANGKYVAVIERAPVLAQRIASNGAAEHPSPKSFYPTLRLCHAFALLGKSLDHLDDQNRKYISSGDFESALLTAKSISEIEMDRIRLGDTHDLYVNAKVERLLVLHFLIAIRAERGFNAPYSVIPYCEALKDRISKFSGHNYDEGPDGILRARAELDVALHKRASTPLSASLAEFEFGTLKHLFKAAMPSFATVNFDPGTWLNINVYKFPDIIGLAPNKTFSDYRNLPSRDLWP